MPDQRVRPAEVLGDGGGQRLGVGPVSGERRLMETVFPPGWLQRAEHARADLPRPLAVTRHRPDTRIVEPEDHEVSVVWRPVHEPRALAAAICREGVVMARLSPPS